MLYSQFYRENKEVIDTEILPYVSSYNLGLDGGRPRIMYRKWSWIWQSNFKTPVSGI